MESNSQRISCHCPVAFAVLIHVVLAATYIYLDIPCLGSMYPEHCPAVRKHAGVYSLRDIG